MFAKESNSQPKDQVIQLSLADYLNCIVLTEIIVDYQHVAERQGVSAKRLDDVTFITHCCGGDDPWHRSTLFPLFNE